MAAASCQPCSEARAQLCCSKLKLASLLRVLADDFSMKVTMLDGTSLGSTRIFLRRPLLKLARIEAAGTPCGR